jgi:large subunit ribosomal protein L23
MMNAEATIAKKLDKNHLTIERIIKRPIALTEKSSQQRALNQFVFEVDRDADKIQVREAVEKLFNVKVVDVSTLVMRGKERRMGRGYAKLQNWKKAIVTLKKGDSIDFFAESES